MNKNASVSNYTKSDCDNACYTEARNRSLNCGTNPNPKNIVCVSKNLTNYSNCQTRCNSWFDSSGRGSENNMDREGHYARD